MKATVFEIKRFAVHDGDGIRTTVFFKGCPLRCAWCHNPEGLRKKSELAYYSHKCAGCGQCAAVCPVGAHTLRDGKHLLDRTVCISCGACADACLYDALTFYGKEMTVEELLPLLLEDREFYESSGGGVTLSGGECLMQADFCANLLKALKGEGIHTAVDTCGAVPKAELDKVIPYTDIFLYDIKAIDEEAHKKSTGCSNRTILENLRYLGECGKQIEIRIPFVPEYNDGQIEKIARFLSECRGITGSRVLPYHNYAGSKYAALGMDSHLPPTLPNEESIQKAKEILKSFGLRCI